MLRKLYQLAITLLVVLGGMFFSQAASAKSLNPTNIYGPAQVTVTSHCPTTTTIVNLPIDPTQLHSITLSGQVNGSMHLYDANGLLNTDITGSAPYSFTTKTSDILYACLTGGNTGTVSFRGQLNIYSTNWAGYTVEGFTASPNEYQIVNANWQVPSVMCRGLLRIYDSSTWTGLGGAPNIGSSKIEQIGTEQNCSATIPSYFAVYENFPQDVVKIDTACKDNSNLCVSVHATVQAGDQIRAQVINRGNGVFLLYEQDITQHWYINLFENEVGGADPSVQYSAEWIEEFPKNQPVSGLANFQQVTFTNCSADGFSINQGGPSTQQLTMKHLNGSIQAQPSSLINNGSSFSVSFVNS